MQKEEFLNEVEAKKNAMKYFPNFLGSDYNITDNKTLEELREEYLKYCEKYFTMIGQNDDNERLMIKKAYEYIKNMLENREKIYQTKSEIVKQVLFAYEKLITAISDYRFRTHGDSSYGANQNQTNQNILLELSLLKPILIMILVNIDTHFGRVSSITEVSFFDNELRKKLEKLIEKLNKSCEIIVYAEGEYHHAWDISKRGNIYTPYIPDSILGELKAEWKLTRNNACQTILDFYRKMQEINMLLDPAYMVHTIDEVNELYNCGINNITRGPNYYCYLSNEERNKLTEQNLLRKRKSKNQPN